jgi:enoyl-CoA hydratase/carnithine racemase
MPPASSTFKDPTLSSDYTFLSYEIDDRVAIITFQRSQYLNALNRQLRAEIVEAVAAADADPDVRVLVITGAGGKSFSTGYDLKEAAQSERKTLPEWHAYLSKNHHFTESVWKCSKPVIAMIDGFCLAGALEFAQMCDLRYCSDDSKFGVVETRFATGIATMIMPWVVGARCREMIFTGDTVDAAEAERIGLVNRVYPKAQLREEVIRIAKRMSQVALACLQWNKRSLNGVAQAQGIDAAMMQGVLACTNMNATETPEFVQFDALRRSEGLKNALAWREAQFKQYE